MNETLIPERLLNQFKNTINPGNMKYILSRISLVAGVNKNYDKSRDSKKRTLQTKPS